MIFIAGVVLGLNQKDLFCFISESTMAGNMID